MTDLKQLKELALKATPGLWAIGKKIDIPNSSGWNTGPLTKSEPDNASVVVEINNYDLSVFTAKACEYVPCADFVEANAAYIAAANPQVILELIEKIERYEEALKFYAEGRHYSDSGEDEWIKPGKVGWDHPPCIEIHDRGDRAKEALNELEKNESL